MNDAIGAERADGIWLVKPLTQSDASNVGTQGRRYHLTLPSDVNVGTQGRRIPNISDLAFLLGALHRM